MRDDAGLMMTFASAFECMDRLAPRSAPVTPSRVGPIHPVKGRQWTVNEDETLLNMYRGGETYRKMAIALGRSQNAIQVRLSMLGYGRP